MRMLREIRYPTYKKECCFCLPEVDLFTDTSESVFGSNESDFEKWLKEQRLFNKRYAEEIHKPLFDICLPENKWSFFILHYERQKREAYLIDQYPTGYFESVNDDGGVCAFLPDTYGKKPYRLSFYRDNGPRYHESYDTREEALVNLARNGYAAKPGALDQLVGTKSWNRGLLVCTWLSSGLSPYDEYEKVKNDPQIAVLFE